LIFEEIIIKKYAIQKNNENIKKKELYLKWSFYKNNTNIYFDKYEYNKSIIIFMIIIFYYLKINKNQIKHIIKDDFFASCLVKYSFFTRKNEKMMKI